MEFCVCCGAVIPEGRWICWQCEHCAWAEPEMHSFSLYRYKVSVGK